MKYEGRAIRLSNRQYTLARKLSHTDISGQGIIVYDMRTLIPMLKSGLIEGSLKTSFRLSEEGVRRYHAFGNSEIERLRTLYIPEFLLTFGTPPKNVERMNVRSQRAAQAQAKTA